MSSDGLRKDDLEVLRGKAIRYVAWHNMAVHEAPWTRGDRSTVGGIEVALEMAERAYQAHGLRYEPGLSKLPLYDPRRFTWICDSACDVMDCVRVRDSQTGRTVGWPWGFE